jgi:hypothetical protein
MRVATLAAGTAVLEPQAAFLLVTAVILSPVLAIWAFVVLPLAITDQPHRPAHSCGAFTVRERAISLFDALLQLIRGMRTIRLYQ